MKAKAAGAAHSQGAGVGAAPRRALSWELIHTLHFKWGLIFSYSGAQGRLPGLTHSAAHCSSRHLVALMLSQFGERPKEPGQVLWGNGNPWDVTKEGDAACMPC